MGGRGFWRSTGEPRCLMRSVAPQHVGEAAATCPQVPPVGAGTEDSAAPSLAFVTGAMLFRTPGEEHTQLPTEEKGGGGSLPAGRGESPCTPLSWRAWNPLLLLAKGESRLPTHSLCWPGWWGARFSVLSGWKFSALLCRPFPPPLARERAGFVGVLCHIQVAGFFGSESGIYEIKTNLRELTAA